MSKLPHKALRLQTSVLPRQQRSTTDPHQPMSLSTYKPANLRATTFEKTTDAYMYDVLFFAFQQDTKFWSEWKVVDCAASVPDKQKTDRIGSAEDRAPIRVVMDLPSMSELPRSYPPPLIGREKPRSVPGLPSGYSVPLEAFTIEDGQLLLERQRVFNEGHIDPRYQWLQDIISSYRQSKDEEDDSGGANATSVVPQPKQKATSVRGFMSWLSGAVGVPEQTQALPPLTSYAGSEQPPAGRNSAGQAIAHEGLVSPYNSRKVASGPFRPREAEEKLNHIEVQSAAEGNPLDAQLQELLSRTTAQRRRPLDSREGTIATTDGRDAVDVRTQAS